METIKADLDLLRRELDGLYRLHRSLVERFRVLEKTQRPKPVKPIRKR